MSTRSVIALNTDNGYLAIYCHFDGYDESNGVGPTLRGWYATPEQASEVVHSGDLSAIKPEKITAYHRDYGDPWGRCKPKRFTQFEDLEDYASSIGKYLYVYESGEWETFRL